MRKAVLAAMVLVGAATAALADDELQVDCSNATSTADQTYCADQDFKKADKQLNAVYRKALAAEADIDNSNADVNKDYVGAVASLKKAQRIWVTYRDAHCDTVGYEAVGGTIQGTIILGCQTEMTTRRIKELKDLIGEDQEN
jgi:uncharacterized protein YecT (DUF1311 family)